LKNAEAVLEKYDGRIAFDCDEKEFRVRKGKRVFVSLPRHPIKSKRRGTRLIRSHKNFYLIRTEIRRKKKSR